MIPRLYSEDFIQSPCAHEGIVSRCFTCGQYYTYYYCPDCDHLYFNEDSADLLLAAVPSDRLPDVFDSLRAMSGMDLPEYLAEHDLQIISEALK